MQDQPRLFYTNSYLHVPDAIDQLFIKKSDFETQDMLTACLSEASYPFLIGEDQTKQMTIITLTPPESRLRSYLVRHFHIYCPEMYFETHPTENLTPVNLALDFLYPHHIEERKQMEDTLPAPHPEFDEKVTEEEPTAPTPTDADEAEEKVAAIFPPPNTPTQTSLFNRASFWRVAGATIAIGVPLAACAFALWSSGGDDRGDTNQHDTGNSQSRQP